MYFWDCFAPCYYDCCWVREVKSWSADRKKRREKAVQPRFGPFLAPGEGLGLRCWWCLHPLRNQTYKTKIPTLMVAVNLLEKRGQGFASRKGVYFDLCFFFLRFSADGKPKSFFLGIHVLTTSCSYSQVRNCPVFYERWRAPFSSRQSIVTAFFVESSDQAKQNGYVRRPI